MNVKSTEKKPFYCKSRFILGMMAALLALSLLVTGFALVLTASPVVYSFGGAKLREDAYSYWFSCYKYIYQIRYRDLGIKDTYEGWMEKGEDGLSYEESFRKMIDERIRLRFVAASLFDSEGYSLSESDRETLNALIEEFKTESFGEIPFEVLEKTYGIKKSAVKQTALYEQKYAALYKQLFSDPIAIYSVTYREALETFYKTYYFRYNIIYVKDEAGADTIHTLESALWPEEGTVTEERFTELEAEYTDENSLHMDKNMDDIEISGNVEYDAATANWGGDWRMPKYTEFEELVEECTWIWTAQNGVEGYRVTGPNGNSIFLPAAGFRYYNSEEVEPTSGILCSYWNSKPSFTDSAYCLFFTSDDYGDLDLTAPRSCGLSIRPVMTIR